LLRTIAGKSPADAGKHQGAAEVLDLRDLRERNPAEHEQRHIRQLASQLANTLEITAARDSQ
jgi:hypothetical protein